MSAAKQNRSIARLIVGAMTIDGSLSKDEQNKVVHSLETIGLSELIADVGIAIEEDDGSFNMYKECKDLRQSLGADADEIAPIIFRVISDVVASDRFVSTQEAIYLSGTAKRLGLSSEEAQKILVEVMAQRRGRLEVSGKDLCDIINPNLKELLSFKGSDDLVGAVAEDSIEELMHNATEALEAGQKVSLDEVERAMTILGLKSNGKLEDAERVWQETIDNLNLPKMSRLGETFVSAAINRISRINDAYKTILHFHSSMGDAREKAGIATKAA